MARPDQAAGPPKGPGRAHGGRAQGLRPTNPWHRWTEDRVHIIHLEDVTDETSLYDLFPVEKFPEAR